MTGSPGTKSSGALARAVDGNCLNLANNPDANWRVIAQIRSDNPNLAAVTEVNASGRADLGNGVLPALARLPLTVLNLHGTGVTDAGLTADLLSDLPNLARLVVPDAVTAGHVDALSEQFPNLAITREG